MSLLMDALKQAEHAKHGGKPDTPAPDAPAPTRAADTSASLDELSLTPVETGSEAAATMSAPTLDLDSIEETLQINHDAEIIAPEPEHVATPEAQPKSTAAWVDIAIPPTALAIETGGKPGNETAPEPNGHQHNDAQAAARILAASAAQQTALRRRNLVSSIMLGTVLTVSIGAYYYYAALSQETPYLGLPQPVIEAEPAASDNTAQLTQDPAMLAATDTVADSAASPADIQADATPLVSAKITPAVDTAAATATPAHTPWQEGLPPAANSTVQTWQPAPVDPRSVRGEPLPGYDAGSVDTSSQTVISIKRSTQTHTVSLDLQTAYNDFQTGRLQQAEQGYRQVLARDTGNRDAHMGLAAIAVRNGNIDSARSHYQHVLQRDPKDLSAHAAMADLSQNRSPESESQLKLLLAEQPQSAQLQFALANLYAEQQRWAYAQQAYFEAQRLEPEHPDYAFNLAVSLEHLGQPKQALEYYRRAIALAGPHNAQFDLGAARQRVEALSKGQP